jgi:hypothetical protein
VPGVIPELGVIQRVPLAYLDLLGLKSSGDSPHFAPVTLDPSIEIRDLYLANRWEEVQGSTTTALAGGGFFASSLAVPSGELWALDGVNVYVNPVAGNTLNSPRIVVYNTQTGAIIRFGATGGSYAGGANVYWSDTLSSGTLPLLMRPSDTIGVLTAPNTWPTGQAVLAWARFARLKV